MAVSKYFVDLTILRSNPVFRQVMVARCISLLGLGFLAVAIPVQAYELSGSGFAVSLVMTLMSTGMLTGLMLGGTLSDRYDRRRLILLARSLCGIGFVGLYINSLLPTPSLYAIYVLVLWDGFFGALGVSGLLGAMVQIVGRDQMPQASAITMIITRFSTIASPAIGGLVIALWGIDWNYAFAAFMTLLTVLSLWGLPKLAPAKTKKAPPAAMILDALKLVKKDRSLLCLFGLGGLMALSPAIRTAFPILAAQSGFDPDLIAGLLYASIPAGTVTGALLSRKISEMKNPGIALSILCFLASLVILTIGSVPNIYLILPLLFIFGAALGAVSVVQMALVQQSTPDSHLGRINSLYMAQENLGMIFGAMIFGSLMDVLNINHAFIGFGACLMGLVLLLRLFLPHHKQDQEATKPAE